MSKFYTVKTGDTFQSIAATSYGNKDLYTFIESANPKGLRVGQVILIPSIPSRGANNLRGLSGKADTEVTILVEGNEIRPESAAVHIAMDKGVRGWTANSSWEPGANKVLDDLLLPFKYPTAALYIGNDLVVNGCVYSIKTSYSGGKRYKMTEGFSFTADAVDSCINDAGKYQWMGPITLEQLAANLLRPVGITPIFEFSSEEPFVTIEASPGDKIFEKLYQHASVRSLLISCSPAGDMVFSRAKSGPSVRTFEEGKDPVIEWSAEFDGRQRYNAYQAIGFGPLSPEEKLFIAVDSQIPRSRVLTFEASDSELFNIDHAAEWKRTKQISQSERIGLKISDWRGDSGKLWEPNTLVTVISKTLMVPNGFQFLVQAVDFELSGSSRTAELTLLPPGVFEKMGTRTIDPWM